VRATGRTSCAQAGGRALSALSRRLTGAFVALLDR